MLPGHRGCVAGSPGVAAWSAYLNLIRDLLEDDACALQPSHPEPAPFTVDDLRPTVLRQALQYLVGQHAPAVGPSIAQHAIEQQVDRLAVVDTQERRLACRSLGDGRARFC